LGKGVRFIGKKAGMRTRREGGKKSSPKETKGQRGVSIKIKNGGSEPRKQKDNKGREKSFYWWGGPNKEGKKKIKPGEARTRRRKTKQKKRKNRNISKRGVGPLLGVAPKKIGKKKTEDP